MADRGLTLGADAKYSFSNGIYTGIEADFFLTINSSNLENFSSANIFAVCGYEKEVGKFCFSGDAGIGLSTYKGDDFNGRQTAFAISADVEAEYKLTDNIGLGLGFDADFAFLNIVNEKETMSYVKPFVAATISF